MHSLLRQFASISHIYVRWLLLLIIGLLASLQMLKDPLANTSYASYDQMVKKRLWTKQADPKIIIVDIDEASLYKLNSEFGRWPWPRETLAGVLDWLEAKGAEAVVFDILFADLDVRHPSSDQAFADAVERSQRSYFPILRLNPINDGISEIHADQLIGFAQNIGNKPAPSLALVPPVFDAIVKTQRMGYHNIYPDKDGINRHYDLWEDTHEWRLWSLPARLGNTFGWAKGETPRVLLNFNHLPNAYVTVPFHEVWHLSQSKAGLASDKRFDGAIILIGSTASSLFDIKATPISTIHPGVYVLANAIDNLKNGNFLYELSQSTKFIIVWVCLLLMGLASAKMKPQVLRWSVLVIPGVLFAVSFLSLHVSNWFIDLSGPASHALLFFTVMSVYQTWRINHFADPLPMVESQIARNGGPLHGAYVVLTYSDETFKPQRLITNAAASGSGVAVTQAGWYGEFIGDQTGPACVLLTNHDSDALSDSINRLVAAESTFFFTRAISPVRILDCKSDFMNSKRASQVLWSELAKALVK